MRDDLAPAGANEELVASDLIGIARREQRVLAYEEAVISNSGREPWKTGSIRTPSRLASSLVATSGVKSVHLCLGNPETRSHGTSRPHGLG